MIKVVIAGSFTEAEKNLYFMQPYLFNAVCNMKEAFGITIFFQQVKEITFTNDGSEFLCST